MRNFIISIVIMAVTVIFILINAAAVTDIADNMLALLEGLPTADESEADNFAAAQDISEQIRLLWRANENYIGLTVGYEYVFAVSSAADTLCAYAEQADGAEYSAAKALLASAVSRIAEAESLSFHNIT